MLSLGKLTPGRASYYVDQLPARADEYYLAGDEAGQAHWIGSAIARLGLDGDVTPEAFRALLDSNHPETGEPLGVPHTTNARVAGFDLCFSSPKSVSVAWALTPPEIARAISEAHDQAVAAAFEAFEAEAVRARRGAGGHQMAETEGVAAAAFPHRSSRAGDPQIHTHVVVPNLTPDSDGRWSALYGARVYRWAKTLGFLYQAELRARLTDTLGVRWTPVRNGVAEIDGLPQELVREFSTRRMQIVAAMEEVGATSARAAQTATLATRPAKHTVADLDTLRFEWTSRAAELGVAPAIVTTLTGHGHPRSPDLDSLAAELRGPRGLTAHTSSFDRRDVLQALAEAHPTGAPVGGLRARADQVLDHPDVVALATGTPAGGRYSTNELLAVEAALIERAQRTLSSRSKRVTDAHLEAVFAERPTLSEEQRAMVTAIATTDSAVVVVVGRAGTGKTYALDAARAAWAEAGRPVIGAALAARAAAELQAGAGIPSTTVDRLLAYLDRPGPLSGLTPGSVVVLDEASMVGTRKLARLLDHTLRRDATLVLVGDPRQLPEIEAGGAVAALARLGPHVELADNRRQRHEWERLALDNLRAGAVPDAVAAYLDRGRITLAPTAEAVREKMVADWWDARRTGTRVGMYALRRSDVQDLNDRARHRLQQESLVGPDLIQATGRDFGIGDEVMCLRNDRRLGVRNGTTATIVAIDPSSGVVDLDNSIRLPSDYLSAGHLAHAYATTIHKAQGATIDRAFLLGSDALFREAGYVGLSRARERSDLYLVSVTPGCDRDLEVDPVTRLTKDLETSRAEQLALDQLQTSRLERNRQHRRRSPEMEAALADPADWMVSAFGEPPLGGPHRDRWARGVERIAAYRHIYAVHGPDPVGPRPDDPTQRRAWDMAELAILEHTRTLELEQGLHL